MPGQSSGGQLEDNPKPFDLLALPIEVRYMIYRELWPPEIKTRSTTLFIWGLILVNRQVSQETLGLLYRGTHFEAVIDHKYIRIANKRFGRKTSLGLNKFCRVRSWNIKLKARAEDELITKFTTPRRLQANIGNFLDRVANAMPFKTISVLIRFDRRLGIYLDDTLLRQNRTLAMQDVRKTLLAAIKFLLEAFKHVQVDQSVDFLGFKSPLGGPRVPNKLADYLRKWKGQIASNAGTEDRGVRL